MQTQVFYFPGMVFRSVRENNCISFRVTCAPSTTHAAAHSRPQTEHIQAHSGTFGHIRAFLMYGRHAKHRRERHIQCNR